jgi:hypothetical protein
MLRAVEIWRTERDIDADFPEWESRYAVMTQQINVSMARIGKLDGGTIVYLATPVLDYMHGAKLILDGGFLSW